MQVPLGFASFAGETRWDCALIAAGGVLAFLVGYVGSATLLFGFDALAHGADRTPQRLAGVFGSIACWGYFAAAFMRGKGGPVLDAAVFPIAIATLAPFCFRWLVFGPDWAGLRERLGFFLFRPDLVLDAAALLLPGMVTFLGVLSVWGSQKSAAEITAWQREHLREEFSDAFVKESDLER